MASFFAKAEASAERAIEMMEAHVQQFVVHSDVQMSCVTGEVIQWLELEIEAVAMSTTVMEEIQM